MSTELPWLSSFSEADISSFKPELKTGLLATVTPEGLPHITMLSTLKASGPRQIIFGQFTEGLSKMHLRQNPKAAWLIMTLDKNLWRGQATFTHTANSGQDYNFYNNTPMARYNANFGIHTVYYFDLVGFYGKQPLPMGDIIRSSFETMVAKYLHLRRPSHAVLNLWTRQLLGKVGNLKFLSYVHPDGYPEIVPVLQMQPLDRQRIVFAAAPYSAELRAIPKNAPAAVFGLTLDMEDVLLRGIYQGIKRIGGVPCGVVDVDWVYNSMPPNPQQIYPEVPLEAVRDF